MKTFEYNFGGKTVRITFNERRGIVTAVEEDGRPFTPCEDRMPIYAGLICLALAQYEIEEVHDDETEIITLDHKRTPWNNPTRQFNNDSYFNR
ncbi:hypothetical protein EII14_05560 [Alloprevotella sp. OH1205_COT-284]|uniref:hypothetical protein n=1 Tax=Alloprevotella sp. OH1205_COT-284 TaxID=2491043 RepID=UPI000F5DD28C|nr:hypothetical protein [Alloprevotella sp. OH1205_COT-284]RRD79764.1 hypothetical protein EII14_05560 [Alloprevotella sp. OH1205_COT-284]